MTVTRVWLGVVLRRAWGSLLFISLVAGLGGSIVVTALLGAERTNTALPRAFAAADPPTARFESDSQSSIDSLAALPGVRAVHPLELYPGRVEGSSADVTLVVTPELKGKLGPLTSGKREERSFRTYGPLKVLGADCNKHGDSDLGCAPENTYMRLNFSNAVEAKDITYPLYRHMYVIADGPQQGS